MHENPLDLAGVERAAAELAHRLAPREDRATLVALMGELGAGKTTFTQSVAKALGITELITSPTFVLEKIYALPEGAAFKRLVHIDAYRLESGADLKALGFDELMQDPKNLIFMEWPKRVADAGLRPDLSVTLHPQGDGMRTLTYA